MVQCLLHLLLVYFNPELTSIPVISSPYLMNPNLNATVLHTSDTIFQYVPLAISQCLTTSSALILAKPIALVTLSICGHVIITLTTYLLDVVLVNWDSFTLPLLIHVV